MAARTNMRSLLFKQQEFASCPSVILNDQRCNSSGCETCGVISEEHSFVFEGVTMKASNTANCKSKNVIYLAICSICQDFYIGQTQTPLNVRVNGHRSTFTDILFSKSALASHIKLDHPQDFAKKVNNFKFSILYNFKSGTPLDRKEDELVTSTRALTKHLNRYKVKR